MSVNVSAVTNHFPTANKGFITTTSSTITSGVAQTTVPLTSVSGLTNATIFVGILSPGTASEREFTGTVDTAGSQITGVKWTDGLDATHTAGTTIVDYVAATGQNMQTKGMLVEHNQDGTHKLTDIITGQTAKAATDGADKLLILDSAASDAPKETTVAGLTPGLSGITASQIDFGGAGSGIWWEEIGRGSVTAGTSLEVSIASPKKYMRILVSGVMTAGTNVNALLLVNNDSANNYDQNYLVVGASAVSATTITTANLAAGTVLDSGDTFGFDMLLTRHSNSHHAIGHGSSFVQDDGGSRLLLQTVWKNTSSAISSFNLSLGANGTAEMVVLGHD